MPTQRAYRGPADHAVIRDFLIDHYAITRHPYLTLDVSSWERISAAPSMSRKIALWEHAGHIVAVAFYGSRSSEFTYLTEPQHTSLEDEIIAWAEAAHRASLHNKPESTPLKCTVCELNTAQQAALTRHGYRKTNAGTVFRKRSLTEPLPDVQLPYGYRFETLDTFTDAQLATKAALENTVIGWSMTTAHYKAFRHSALYRPELDMVIMAYDGDIAAFSTLWFDAQNRIGFFEPVGTGVVHRQRGLGKALMIEGLRRLLQLEATTAYLGNSDTNEAGNRLYEAVGMPIFDREYIWQKAI